MNMNVEKLNVGSLRYMAPETLNGASKQIGPALDVWAMGVILYSLVTGHFPFKGPTSLDTIRAIT
jgi:MAP/microtubule affinity-regulating kinase